MTMVTERTKVIICGGGPTGVLLSTLLGQAGVDNICLEKEAEITTDPRGIALDEDGIRALQSIGIYDKVYSTIGSCMGVFNFVGGTRQDLSAKPFLRHDYTTSEGGTGHVGFICHKQPVMEKCIRDAMAGTDSSDLRTSCNLTSIEEVGDHVEVTYEDAQRNQHRLEATFLVGADGKKGFTRKHYLEPKGISMDQASGYQFCVSFLQLYTYCER
jgi:2-polyprenyl-6-methoxyphenol hydroxylase-like FAD-dependent oxidoreductase